MDERQKHMAVVMEIAVQVTIDGQDRRFQHIAQNIDTAYLVQLNTIARCLKMDKMINL